MTGQRDGLVVDVFAGGGGASLGIVLALGRCPDIAIDHDPEAMAMHEANHPGTRHVCDDVWAVDPTAVCAGRRVALAWFSPECTQFSRAKGGKPLEPESRDLAWVVVRWARAVRPRVIIVENVEEFADWWPLRDDGRPDADRRGVTFRRWVLQLKRAGYKVDSRILRACDFGAPTSRRRLFVIARRDRLPIVWPSPTHGPGRSAPYRFGLVSVHGENFAIADIGMRMLTPRELFRAQGFPDSYVIDPLFRGKPLPKTAQVRMCGNSVCPPVAAALVAANVDAAYRLEQESHRERQDLSRERIEPDEPRQLSLLT